MLLANCKMKMISTRSNVEKNIFELKEQKAATLENVKEPYNETFSKLDQVYADTLIQAESVFEKTFGRIKTPNVKTVPT